MRICWLVAVAVAICVFVAGLAGLLGVGGVVALGQRGLFLQFGVLCIVQTILVKE